MKKLGDLRGLGLTYETFGNIYTDLNYYQNAISYYAKFYIVAEQDNDTGGMAVALSQIGNILKNKSFYREGILFFDEQLRKVHKTNTKHQKAIAHERLAMTYLLCKQYEEAMIQMQIHRQLVDEMNSDQGRITSLILHSVYDTEMSNISSAVEYLLIALNMKCSNLVKFEVCLRLGKLYIKQDDFISAKACLLDAIQLAEKIMDQLTGDLPVVFLDASKQVYQLIQLAMIKLGQIEEALIWSEKSRSKALFNSINQKFKANLSDFGDDIPIDSVKRTVQKYGYPFVVYSTLTVEDDTEQVAVWVIKPEGDVHISITEWQPQKLMSSLNGIRMEVSRIYRDINLMDEKQDFIEDLSPVIKKVLPDHDHAKFIDDLYSSMQQSTTTESPGNHRGFNFGRKTANTGGILERQLETLYTQLWSPIEHLIKEENVVIIPHANINFVPFNFLKNNQGTYLFENICLTQMPSICCSLLLKAIQPLIDRSLTTLPLVVSNPVMPEGLDELPGTVKEANGIRDIIGQITHLTNAKVTEEHIMTYLESARFIHFATHGVVNQLKRNWFFKDSGLAISNGYLQSKNIENLRPIRSFFIMFSACSSAVGHISQDGMFGIPRAFMTLGVPHSLVTLWALPDDGPAQILVQKFYAYVKQEECANIPKCLQRALKDILLLGNLDVKKLGGFYIAGIHSFSQ